MRISFITFGTALAGTIAFAGCGGDTNTAGSASAKTSASASASAAAVKVDSPATLCKRMNELEKKKKPDAKDDTAECTKNYEKDAKENEAMLKCMYSCAEKADLDTAEKCMEACPKPKEAAEEPASSASAAPAPDASAAPDAD